MPFNFLLYSISLPGCVIVHWHQQGHISLPVGIADLGEIKERSNPGMLDCDDLYTAVVR